MPLQTSFPVLNPEHVCLTEVLLFINCYGEKSEPISQRCSVNREWQEGMGLHGLHSSKEKAGRHKKQAKVAIRDSRAVKNR